LDQAAAPGPTSAACVSGEPVASPQRSAQRPPSRTQRAATHRPSSPAAADGSPIIAVASPKGGSGKTTLSLNLAVSLAESGLRVVLVDADPNGDVLSAISARGRATTGLFEAVAGDVDAAQLLLNTAIPNLKVVPAMGPNVLDGIAERLADSTMTRLVFQGLRGGADVVVVDTPAGMFGMTAQILEISTHVIGVLQAESIARRSFSMFQQGLNVLGHRPNVLGVVLNMFRRSHSASLAVLLDAGLDMPDGWLFQTTIPRNDVFLEASESGRPVRFTETDSASVISLLFDTLASEVKDRLALVQSVRPKLQGSFLV
jgi:chromosome partitioning protein